MYSLYEPTEAIRDKSFTDSSGALRRGSDFLTQELAQKEKAAGGETKDGGSQLRPQALESEAGAKAVQIDWTFPS